MTIPDAVITNDPVLLALLEPIGRQITQAREAKRRAYTLADKIALSGKARALEDLYLQVAKDYVSGL